MPDILIIEDGANERERLNKLFSNANFSVSCAESADEAEQLSAQHDFRLAVLDIGLGDKSGTHLFERFKRSAKIPFVIVLTGNPSVHLKQRFLDEGAVAYIVKASSESSNESLLDLVRSLLGSGKSKAIRGLALGDFLRQCCDDEARKLFLDAENKVPPCKSCGGATYLVRFDHKPQLPPCVEGMIVCAGCGSEMDAEIV